VGADGQDVGNLFKKHTSPEKKGVMMTKERNNKRRGLKNMEQWEASWTSGIKCQT